MDEVTARVARQYGEHAYPKPVDDLAAAAVDGAMELLIEGLGLSVAAGLVVTDSGGEQRGEAAGRACGGGLFIASVAHAASRRAPDNSNTPDIAPIAK